MRLIPLGVRGSTPTPGAAFVRYGGHTSCMAVLADDQAVPSLVLDAGTGLRALPRVLDGRAFHGTIVLTHLHWDHVQGLPFCRSAPLGSKTQMVSLVAFGFVVMSLLLMRPTLGDIPRPALAAVIVSAAFAIIDVAGYRSLWRVSREEFVLAVATALGVLLFNVVVGVLVTVVLSIVVALDRIARSTDAILGDAPGLDGWVEVGSLPGAFTEPGLVVYRFDAPLCFVNADRFCERVEQVVAENPGRDCWLVIDFEGIGALDATALDAMTSLLDRLAELGVVVFAAARANRLVLRRLERASLLAPIGAFMVFPTINSAVSAYRQQRDRGADTPDHRPTSSGPSALVAGGAG